ncbi:MAG: hypothetical protein P3B98_01410 [Gemmatimonadota bacterium]|nr:hypothetical protein [Gemmatimonadota bacterium]
MGKQVAFTLRFDVERVVAVVALVFGLATVLAGGSVLRGRDPGYVVYRPLLVFNTIMGGVYLAAAMQAWRRQASARAMAAAIVMANAAVWLWIMVRSRPGDGAVADDSVRAMTLRLAVWVVLFALLNRVWRRKRVAGGV